MTVLLLAHGSADPRHAADITAIADRLRRRLSRPVATAYLDHCGPRVSDVRLPAGPVLVVPLLLAPGFHAKQDVPAAVAQLRERHGAPVTQGPAPLLTGGAAWAGDLIALARQRYRGFETLLVTAGSSDPEVAAGWRETEDRWGTRVRYLSGTGPRLAEEELTDRTVIVPALLARGHFSDRLAATAKASPATLADPLGSWQVFDDELVSLCQVPARQPGTPLPMATLP